LSENAKAEQYGSPVESSLALRGEDEVNYEPFTWVRSLKIGIGWFAENASLLSKNAKVKQHGSAVKSSLALMEQGQGQKSEPFPYLARQRSKTASEGFPYLHTKKIR